MLDRQLIERTAGALSNDEVLVEKDWYIVRAIGVIASLDHAGATPVFSGGTSLSKGWGLIKRFSEDIAFKVMMPQDTSGTASRNKRRAFRERILSALLANEFELLDKPLIGNQSQFFAADLAYQNHFCRPKFLTKKTVHMIQKLGLSSPPSGLQQE